MQSTIEHSYQYPFASQLSAGTDSTQLYLATDKRAGDYPHFFEGRLTQPRTTAQLLFLLSRVVGTRFYTPPAMLQRIIAQSDPVITSGGGLLRLEGFSACCSAYARVDITPDAYLGEVVGTGTTNVDFNAAMRQALVSIRDDERLSLAVGRDVILLKRGADQVVERKVQLPLRWIKGFVEVQSYQSKMQLRHTLSKVEAIRFLRSIPANAHNQSVFWAIASGHGLRLSQTVTKDGVKVGGLARLYLLKNMAALADELKVYAHPQGEASEWHLRCGGVQLSMAITAEPSRGFSGEGQVLNDIASAEVSHLARIRSALKWQSIIDANALARDCGVSPADATRALAILGSRGLVGYDLGSHAFFHREIPFDMDLVEEIHPRLKAAKKLVSEGGVKVLSKSNSIIEAEVKGSGVNHRSKIESNSDSCSCQWHAKYQGARGPCKHILAVKLAAGVEET